MADARLKQPEVLGAAKQGHQARPAARAPPAPDPRWTRSTPVAHTPNCIRIGSRAVQGLRHAAGRCRRSATTVSIEQQPVLQFGLHHRRHTAQRRRREAAARRGRPSAKAAASYGFPARGLRCRGAVGGRELARQVTDVRQERRHQPVARSAHAGSSGSARRTCAASAAATSARIAGRGATAPGGDDVRDTGGPGPPGSAGRPGVPRPQRRERVGRARRSAPIRTRAPGQLRSHAAPGRHRVALQYAGDRAAAPPVRRASAGRNTEAATQVRRTAVPAGARPHPGHHQQAGVRRGLDRHRTEQPCAGDADPADRRPRRSSGIHVAPWSAMSRRPPSGAGRSRCRSRTSRAALGSAARHSWVAHPLALAPSATRSSRRPPPVSCITLVNSSSRNRSAMSSRYCRSPVPAGRHRLRDRRAVQQRRDHPARVRLGHRAVPRGRGDTAARLSISPRANRPLTGSRAGIRYSRVRGRPQLADLEL